jgi:CubicO group peptidase (beta-lactamase class C family)
MLLLRGKIWFWGVPALGLLAAVAIFAPPLYRMAWVGSGFIAQRLCSETFIAKRPAAVLFDEDLSGPGYELLRFFRSDIDVERKRASASLLGIGGQTSIYREGLGCTRFAGRDEAELRAEASTPAVSAPAEASALWPEGERVDLASLPESVDAVALNAAIDATFAEPNADAPRRTRALIVVHDGRIVAERYAERFGADVPMIGWSMTKTALNALIGLRVKDGKLAAGQDSLLREWRSKADQRAKITLDALLTMTSGLAFDESYGDTDSDVVQMLFGSGDMARYAAAKPLLSPPGSEWHYSSGTSLILSRVLRNSFASEDDYLAFPRRRLFDPLGMRSAVLESDTSGTFVASSFLYASPRDWARLGLLYLRDGVWNGERLLPEGWVQYSLTSAPSSDGRYGAQLWLKLPQSDALGEPPMPEDAFYMLGHDEQIVAIVPSRDLVIVRLGLTRKGGDWDSARDLGPIVGAFPAAGR